MTVDTAIFVTSAGQSKEECNLVCFTEARDEEVSVRVHDFFEQWWGLGLAALTASALTLGMGQSRTIRSQQTDPEGERRELIPKTRELIL